MIYMDEIKNYGDTNICLLNDNTINIAHHENNAKRLAGQFLHTILFHQSISLMDHWLVNSPAFRKALQKYLNFRDTLTRIQPTILVREQVQSLIELRDILATAGTYHPSHSQGTFLENSDISLFDRRELFKRYKIIDLARSFDYRVLNEGFKSDFAIKNIPESLRCKITDFLYEIKSNKENGLLDQADFERASRPDAPLERKLGKEWKKYETVIFQIERAYYSTAIGHVFHQPFIFSPDHSPTADVLGKAIVAPDSAGEQLESLHLESDYISTENLINLPSSFYISARKSDEFQRWIQAMCSVAEASPGSIYELKEVRNSLNEYLRWLDSKIKDVLRSDAEKRLSHFETTIHEGIRNVYKAASAITSTTAATLENNMVRGIIINLGVSFSGLSLLHNLGFNLFAPYVSYHFNEKVPPAVRYFEAMLGEKANQKEDLIRREVDTIKGVKAARHDFRELFDTHIVG